MLFVGLVLALALKKARLHPAMWVTLALMCVAALLAPEWALGGWAVHLRLPAVFGSLLFASAEIRLKPAAREPGGGRAGDDRQFFGGPGQRLDGIRQTIRANSAPRWPRCRAACDC